MMDDKFITKKDEKHEKYINILDDILIPDFDGYKITSILFNDIWFSFNMKFSYVIKHVLARLITNYLVISKTVNNGNKSLLFTFKYQREDHDRYWNEFKLISNIRNELELKYYYSLSLNKEITHDILKFFKIYQLLKEIDSIKSRIWLSLQLLNALKIISKLEAFDKEYNAVYMFYDGGFEGNIVSQFYKQQGATTITLQHGQCLYRDHRHDRINQSVILNFISDYCLCKGEFAKNQFVKAGFDESRLLPLGNLDFSKGFDERKLVNDEKKAFCVFLDTPSYPFYKESTKQLIDAANFFCKEYDFTYLIKPHPADKEKSYLESLDRKYCKEILDSNHYLEEIGKKIDFSIFHASAIYADLLLRNIKAYKLETEIDFDIVLDEFDTFTSIDELHEKNEIWINTDVSKKYAFFKEQNELYSNPYDVKRRYQDFIKSLDD
jgi:hypothetical protein